MQLDVWSFAQFNPWIRIGEVYLTRFTGRGLELWARCMEDLTPARLGTLCHHSRSTCPTWTEVTECRCMVEGI